MAGVQTNRTNIELPTELAREIIQSTQEQSAVMRLARRIELPGRGLTIPVIVEDPEASWVGETVKKPVNNPEISQKIMQAYKLAVIVPFSDEFRRDAAALYDELVRRLPLVLAQKFDATVFGAVAAPGSNFDTFTNITAQSLIASGTNDAYDGLVAADTDISVHGGIVNGYVLSPQGKGLLLAERDGDNRPLFINNVAEGAIPVILGSPVRISKGAYIAPDADTQTPATLGFVGDWTKAMYGTVEGVQINYSSDATLDLGDGTTVNLFQQNMFAVRAEIELGFRADLTVFNKLTGATA